MLPRQERVRRVLSADPDAGGCSQGDRCNCRKLAERVYRLLRYGEAYVRQDVEAYEAAYRAWVVKGLTRRATELGYRLEPTSPAIVVMTVSKN